MVALVALVVAQALVAHVALVVAHVALVVAQALVAHVALVVAHVALVACSGIVVDFQDYALLLVKRVILPLISFYRVYLLKCKKVNNEFSKTSCSILMIF